VRGGTDHACEALEETRKYVGIPQVRAKLPTAPLQVRNDVEVVITGNNCEGVLAAERRNPEIVDGNRLTDPPEVQNDSHILAGGFLTYIKNGRVG